MTLLKFFFWFSIFVESIFPIFPILIGWRHRNKMNLGVTFFICFLITDLILYWMSDYYYLKKQNNLFLHYFHDLFGNTLILLMYCFFFKSQREKIIIFSLLTLGNLALLIDFLFFSQQNDYNFYSATLTKLIVLVMSIYYFSTTFLLPQNKNKENSDVNLMIALTLTFQYFIKLVHVFLENFMVDTQNHAYLLIQEANIYSCFMLSSLIFYTYAFYNIKRNEK